MHIISLQVQVHLISTNVIQIPNIFVIHTKLLVITVSTGVHFNPNETTFTHNRFYHKVLHHQDKLFRNQFKLEIKQLHPYSIKVTVL